MDNKKALQGCGIGCFGLIVIIGILAFVLVSCSVDGEEEDKAFDFTVDEYEATLKETVSDASAGTYLKTEAKIEIEENRYRMLLTDNIFAFIHTNDEGKVTDVSMGTTGNAFLATNKEVMIAFKSLVKSMDTSLSVTQSMVLFNELGITGDSSMLDHKASYALNGVSYAYIGNIEEDTLFLLVEPE